MRYVIFLMGFAVLCAHAPFGIAKAIEDANRESADQASDKYVEVNFGRTR